MAGYDKRQLKRWLKKQTGSDLIGSSLIPAKKIKRPHSRDEGDAEDNGRIVSCPTSSVPSLLSMSMQQAIQYVPLSPPTYATISGTISEAKNAIVEDLKTKMDRLADQPPAQIRKPSPDYVHTIVSWRGWTVASGLLQAVGSYDFWKPRVAERAICKHAQRNPDMLTNWFSASIDTKHACPGMRCSCGYWSFKTRELFLQAVDKQAAAVQVVGTVECWGRVIECENGYRSEYAYPKELWLLRRDIEYLSWIYGVPVRKL